MGVKCERSFKLGPTVIPVTVMDDDGSFSFFFFFWFLFVSFFSFSFLFSFLSFSMIDFLECWFLGLWRCCCEAFCC